MNKLICPVIAHKLHNLEPLSKMEALTVGGNINTFVEVIGALSVNRRGNITGRIQSAAVRSKYKTRRHIILRQVNDRRAVVDFQKALVAHKLHLFGHLIRIKALACIAVKGNIKLFEGLFILFKGNINKPLPQLSILLIMLLELFVLVTRPLIKAVVLFGLGVEFHIQSHQSVNAACFHLFLGAPHTVSGNKLSELSAPVTQMVYTYAVVACKLMKLFK